VAAETPQKIAAPDVSESVIAATGSLFPGQRMEFTALFLAITIAMLIAWHGPRPLAIGFSALILVACVATFLHHATDQLNLSF
jgi:hypothetical protein